MSSQSCFCDICFVLYLQEKATIPAEYFQIYTFTKRFPPEIEVRDFLSVVKPFILRIKRRRREDPPPQTYDRWYTGTSTTAEFGAKEHLDNHAVSCQSVAEHYCEHGKQLLKPI
ncbi:MAG: hypothetical protein ACLSFV_24340 [Bacteroides xylanisolvens]